MATETNNMKARIYKVSQSYKFRERSNLQLMNEDEQSLLVQIQNLPPSYAKACSYKGYS